MAAIQTDLLLDKLRGRPNSAHRHYLLQLQRHISALPRRIPAHSRQTTRNPLYCSPHGNVT